jgi:hypothetical protein
MNAITPVDLGGVDVTPILPSLNFSQTRNFYVDALGFEQQAAPCEEYLVLRRGRMVLHFWSCDDPHMSMNSSVFIRSDSLDPLYEEYLARGVEGLVRIEDGDCDGKVARFYVRDPHGNLLLFGRRETASL